MEEVANIAIPITSLTSLQLAFSTNTPCMDYQACISGGENGGQGAITLYLKGGRLSPLTNLYQILLLLVQHQREPF